MATDMLNAALGYAKKGWPIFPCRQDKTPYTTHGVNDATTNPEVIEGWWKHWPGANIGLNVGEANMLVLDLDPGHDLKELESNVGPLPSTALSARSPRGGYHLYFHLSEGEVVSPSASKLASAVDVRSFNSYVLLAPSSTKDGSYTWESEGKPAYRTDEMVRVANSHREKHEDRDKWIVEADLPENVSAAVSWLKSQAKISVENQGGDSIAYATAAHMKSFAVSEERALELMWDHWNPRCNPPWTEDQFDHFKQKVENGYAYNTSPPGNVTEGYRAARAALLFQPVYQDIPSGREVVAGRFRFVDREGIQHIRPPEWLIEDFLPQEAYAIMFGPSGTFKTFLALDIALSVATGFPQSPVWPGITGKGPVLFSAGEGRPQFRKRVEAWEQMHWGGMQANGLILGDPVPHVSEQLEPFIEGALSLSPKGYKLVVIDTIGRAMAGVNENAQEYASKFTQMVEAIQSELGATVLCLHHTGHTNEERERGSGVFGADADTRIQVTRQGKHNIVALAMVKQKDAVEWAEPKHVKLLEVQVTPELKSLVAMTPDQKDEATIEQTQIKKDDAHGNKKITDELLCKAIIEILESNKTIYFSNTKMSQMLADRDDIDVGSKTLASHRLKPLREDSKSPVKPFYDAPTGRWRMTNVN